MLNVYIITHIVVKFFPATTISRCTGWIPRSPSTKKLKRKEGKKERKKERKKKRGEMATDMPDCWRERDSEREYERCTIRARGMYVQYIETVAKGEAHRRVQKGERGRISCFF